MNTRSVVVILLSCSHIVVAVACFKLGRREPPADAPTTAGSVTLQNENSSRENRQDRLTLRPGAASSGGNFSQRLQAVASRVTKMEANGVLDELRTRHRLPASPDNLLINQLLLGRYAALDPETALSYVDSLTGLAHEFSQQTVMQAWASNDPTGAAEYFERNREDFGDSVEAQSVAAGNLAAEWAKESGDLALGWAMGLSEDLRGEAVARTVSEMASADPLQAAMTITRMRDGVDREVGMEALARQWAYQDPQAAAAWIESNTSGTEQSRATASIVGAWMMDHPKEASSWMASQPSSPNKDAAILAMTESRHLRRDLEAAAVWSSTIEDTRLRTETLNGITRRWFAQDPDRATEWLRSQQEVTESVE